MFMNLHYLPRVGYVKWLRLLGLGLNVVACSGGNSVCTIVVRQYLVVFISVLFCFRNVGNPKKLPSPLDLGLCMFIW